MSESELSDAPTPDLSEEILEQCLSRIVRNALDNNEEVTINSARSAAEAELELENGFLKRDPWKTRTKSIITAAVEQSDVASSPVRNKSTNTTKSTSKAGTKRKQQDVVPKNKRRKNAATPTSDSVVDSASEPEQDVKPQQAKERSSAKAAISDDDESDAQPEDDSPSKPTKKAESKSKSKTPRSDEESVLSEPPKTSAEPETQHTNGDAADDSSQYSIVLDEPSAQAKKKRATRKKAAPEKSSKAASSKSKASAASKNTSPDEEEIKRLQGWLLKCGIRKVWGKELKKFDTNKEKIKHLKSLLGDIGMTGRFSQEKARQIKEARELEAELAETKAFNETWGHNDAAESEEEEKPRRKLRPRGLVDLGDFGGEGSD